MSESFGSGVSRTISAIARQFDTVVFQQSKPPLDSEVNLLQQVQTEACRSAVRSRYPSGFFGTSPSDFVVSANYSNLFYLGTGTNPLVANVNGMIIPLAGTQTNSLSNKIRLLAPPSSGATSTFVYLEAWRCLVAPNPSTANKPSASTIHYLGNTDSLIPGIPDDLEDTTIGFETTERVQVQYRLRVVDFPSPEAYPEPLDSPVITAFGTGTSASLFTFSNMASEGDSGCWRAGSGDPSNSLGTVDGYSYAIPVCMVFRRNTAAYQISNQNGARNRNLSASSLGANSFLGAFEYTVPVLTSPLAASDLGIISVTDLVSSPLGDSGFVTATTLLNPSYLVLSAPGFREVVSITAVDTVGGTITISARGLAETVATGWPAGTEITIFNSRVDGLYADSVTSGDILDLRKTIGHFDYQQLLQETVSRVLTGSLQTTWKQAPAGPSRGPSYLEVDYAAAALIGPAPVDTLRINGPDGIRSVFSGSAVDQEFSFLLDPANADLVTGVAVNFATGTVWEAAPITVSVTGFIPDPGVSQEWKNGAVIFLNFAGVKNTFVSGTGTVRPLTPREMFQSQFTESDPAVSVQFLDHGGTFPEWDPDFPVTQSQEAKAGPMYPLFPSFMEPFTVLGDIVEPAFVAVINATDIDDTDLATTETFEIDLGIDFDNVNYGTDTDFDPAEITSPLLGGQRTLGSMITCNGSDPSGLSSELYLLCYGDATTPGIQNNGVFRIVGAGSHGYAASSNTQVRLQLVSHTQTGPVPLSGGSLTCEIRSPYTVSSGTAGTPELALVLTNLESLSIEDFSPWSSDWLRTGDEIPSSTSSLMVLRGKCQYSQNLGLAHVPDEIVSVRAAASTSLLRQPLSVFDPTLAVAETLPVDTLDFPVFPFSLSSEFQQGAETATSRTAECFVDAPSKTWVFRPLQSKLMSLKSLNIATSGAVIPADTLSIWNTGTVGTSTTQYALPVPKEALPKFGRLDIPYYRRQGTDPILSGINHLFQDSLTDADDVFRIIGGEPDSVAPGSVKSMLFQSSSSGYGTLAAIGGTGQQAIRARQRVFENEISEETNKVIQGIELPPFFGVARLYGVYEISDYIANFGVLPGAFQADRITPRVGGPVNLLRENAQYHTLHIVQNGADADTSITGSHTYVITDQALDLTRISGFDPATQTLQDYQYVVECVVFGFAPGFIDRHPYVLIRRYDGQAGLQTNTTLTTPLELAPSMIFPYAAPSGTEVEISYLRTAYQGDPFLTSTISSAVPQDSEGTYGSITGDNARLLDTIMQQYDLQQQSLVEFHNPRVLRVLSELDFWTTDGTGKIQVPGNDPSFLRGLIPATGNRQVRPRVFSKKPRNPSSFVLQVVSYSDLISGSSLTFDLVFTLNGRREYTPVFTTDFSTVTSNEEMAEALFFSFLNDSWIKNTFYFEQVGTRIYFIPYERGSAGNLIRVEIQPQGVDILPLRRAIAVRFGMRADYSSLDFAPTVKYNHASVGSGFLRGGDEEPSLPVTGTRTPGAISRLPLGAVVNESDFVGESPLGKTTGILPSTVTTPYLVMTDGTLRVYTGVDSYRLERGATVSELKGRLMSPVKWELPVSGTKSPVMVGKAYLVLCEQEEAYTSPVTTTYGGELQVVMVTYAADPGENEGTIGVIGFGEGRAAADRYRIQGRPHEIAPEFLVELSELQPAPYVEGDEIAKLVVCVCP